MALEGIMLEEAKLRWLLTNSTYRTFWKRQNYRDREQRVVVRDWDSRERIDYKEKWEFWGAGNSLYLDCSGGGYITLYFFHNYNKAIYSERVNLTGYKAVNSINLK